MYFIHTLIKHILIMHDHILDPLILPRPLLISLWQAVLTFIHFQDMNS